jgi:ABC-type uncharacterized transport system substrate-binding protein
MSMKYIIQANSTPATAAVQREMRTIPIVFVNVGDRVANSRAIEVSPSKANAHLPLPCEGNPIEAE